MPLKIIGLLTLFCSTSALAEGSSSLHLTGEFVGIACLIIFVVAYLVVMLEEQLHLRKSIPVLLGAGLIWGLIGFETSRRGLSHQAEQAVRHYLLEFGELFLFLLSAMTYINTMGDRGCFEVVRDRLISKGLSLRQLFWLTGLLAFFISPVADNLTTTLLMGAVLMAVAGDNPRYCAMGCLNIVVAANAGGAFSPFGDITTLMVWQKGLVEFSQFFALFLPALVNWLVPAALMSLAIENRVPQAPEGEPASLRPGALTIVVMFLATVALAVFFHASLGLPPVLGMLTGLGVLKLYGYWLSGGPGVIDEADDVFTEVDMGDTEVDVGDTAPRRLDVFKILEQAEWDTLMFFAGVILCVGGLGTLGYLEMLSTLSYGTLGATQANIGVGILSAIIDNIPVMVAVLAMGLDLDLGQWLLVTLTAGVGGSMLSIGSAAGVALMGQARGIYTFASHLRWSWAVALGYGASIWTHFLVNASLFR
jgi:Na+/H+ antiporter NhaD/arsenite permease-like protein